MLPSLYGGCVPVLRIVMDAFSKAVKGISRANHESVLLARLYAFSRCLGLLNASSVYQNYTHSLILLVGTCKWCEIPCRVNCITNK